MEWISGDAPWRQAGNKGLSFPSVSICLFVSLSTDMRDAEARLAFFSQTKVHCFCAQPTIQAVCFQWFPSMSTPVLRWKNPAPASDAWYKSSKTFWLEGSKLSKPAFTSANNVNAGELARMDPNGMCARSVDVTQGPPNSEANDLVGEGWGRYGMSSPISLCSQSETCC